MDDDSAEIELLEQNLNKTHQISQRMTSILTNFDTRLMKLEKSILPLYNSTQKLKQRAHNIDRALLKIDEVASSQDGIAVEEGLVLRGPQLGQLEAYIDILERLNAAIAFKSSDADSRDIARLIETGAKKLTQLYTKLVAEGSSGSPPVSGLAFMLTEFPPSLMSSLTPLVNFLRTLPLPSTHPSHPAASAILNTLKDAQRGYADMRGNWSRKALEMHSRRVVDRAETLDGVAAGKEFGIWIDNLLKVTETEYTLLAELAPLSSNSLIASTYDTLLTPLLTLFTDTLSSLTSLIKRSLHKYTFHALSAFSALSMSQSRWESVLARRGREGNELRDGLNAIRGVCLRSFPEFLADLKLAAVGKGGDLSVSLADITVSTVQYLNRIPDVQDAVGSALSALGDGNWKMGDGKQVGKTPKSSSVEVNEKVLIQHFVFDVINTLIGSLTTLSRTQRRPPFGSVFLLNNISYLVSHLVSRPTNPSTPSLLSKPTMDFLTSSWRTAKAGYFDANFSPLMQALADDARDKTSGSGWKAAAKEKFTRFYDLFEEVGERHRMAKVLEEDSEERSAAGEEVIKLVVPSLQRFMQKQKEKEFSKNIKLSPEEVESRIRNFYK
ncbi:Cullin repeat-like-containing domain protein [Suillus paluster]|uniref:Cullin repeat-like-containing domain protein n=1 Tax=Suillus paluster TaxID=48578 RepID=UPI001B85EEBF|nr:Cullin repeat-like-containing domain protein [Suillus paluster]KAG1726007.1 Cullin repeat-like-containing domain protein [Suillus paluster]